MQNAYALCSCIYLYLPIVIWKNGGQNTFSRHVYIPICMEQNNFTFRSSWMLHRLGSTYSLRSEILWKELSMHASSTEQIPKLLCSQYE
jgi:hypothetical protein